MTRWTAAYLEREWPTLDTVPDGVDMFAAYPVHYPRDTCRQCHGYGKALGANGEWDECPTCHGRGTQ